MKGKLPAVAFFGAALLCAFQAFHYRTLLPERIASHFGPSGAPDGWMESSFFIKINLAVIAFLVLSLYSASNRMRTVDPAAMRLPNKDYWLAPERRAETIEFLSGYFLWFGAATMVLMLDIFRQVFQYNLFLTRELDHPRVSLGLYVGFALLWIAGLQLRFRKK